MCPHTTLECALLGIIDYATHVTPLTIPWTQQEAYDLHREYKNVVVQVPVGSLGQLFHAMLMSELFMVLGLPYTVNEGQE